MQFTKKKLGLLNLEKRWLQGELTAAFQYLKGAGDRVFSRVCCNKPRDYGFKLKEGRFKLHLRKKLFYDEGGGAQVQVVQRGGKCPIPGNTEGQVGQELSSLV